MSNVILMAGTAKSLCQAWHTLSARERQLNSKRQVPGCPAKTTQRTPTCLPCQNDV